jgi:hypothetical protein
MNAREEIIVELLLQIRSLDNGMARSEVNHENAGPETDEENNRILSASIFHASHTV